MSGTIYGLQCDFEQQQGHFMTIFRKEPSPIHSDELANIQVKMMGANTINKILPLKVQELDFNVKLYYDISAKKMLSQYVRERFLSMNELYELLYHICSAIESSKEYMLDEEHFVLDEDFIFIGSDIKEIELTYLPLKEINHKPALHDEFRELFFNLFGFVKALSGDGVQQLTNYLNGDEFQLRELMKKLDQLRQNTAQAQAEVPRQQEPSANPYAAATLQQQSSNTPSSVSIKQPSHSKEHDKNKSKGNASKKRRKKKRPKRAKKDKKKTVKKTQSVVKEEEKESPSPIVVFCIGILGLAIIWKMYQSIPSEGMLYVSTGLSIGVFAGIYYFLAVYGKSSGNSSMEFVDNDQLEKPKQKRRMRHQGVQPKRVDEDESHTGGQNPMQKPMSPSVNAENYFQNLHQETTLLSQPEATVLLDASNQEAQGLAYLEVNRNDQTEKIQLRSDSFIIGRNESAVQYVETTAGVSRTHIEITKNATLYSIKDLGSRNGSKLNGEKMVAYKNYPLNDGDQIRIAKITYTFHKG